MHYRIRHHMISEELIHELDNIIDHARTMEWERERYFSKAIYEQQQRHRITYTSEELKKLRCQI